MTTLLGRYTPRIDGVERVTGRAAYVADWKVPRMIYGKVVLSPVPHAKVVRVDTEKARRLPGVEAILTFDDTRVRWFHGDRVNQRYAITDKVRFPGDVVAAVAARRREIAEQAVELLDIDYERLPAVFDVQEALRADAPKIWDLGNLHQLFSLRYGDAEGALQRSDRVFEDTYRTARCHSVPLEPAASLAWWTGDHLTLVASTQGISSCREALAKDLGLPLNRIRVLSYYKGGGFGNKNRGMNHDLLAALLAKRTGKPVLLEYSRREDFINIHGRWSTDQHLRIGATRDGALTAYAQTVHCDTGAYARSFVHYSESALDHYNVSNIQSDIYAVYTNTPATAHMRAPESYPSYFGAESMMDQIAHEMHLDPLQFRQKNRARNYHGEKTYTSDGLDECIRLGAERIGWTEKWHRPDEGPTVDGVLKHGIGMATCQQHAELGPGAALIRVNQDGTAQLAVGVTDIGTGAKTTMALIAADVLGLPLQDIGVVWGDTDVCPYSIGESASRTTTYMGTAVRVAANDAKTQLLEIAGRQLDAKPQDLRIADRTIYVEDDPRRRIPLAKVAEAMPDAIIGRGATQPELPAGVERRCFAAAFADVLVDTETGVVTVSRYVSAHDSGPIVNRLTAENQVQGSVIMGLGSALKEELIVDREHGMIANADMWTYRLPTQHDAPRIDVLFVETDDPYGPKPISEIALFVVAPVIGNAIFNATGVRLKATPMTPDRVHEALVRNRSRAD